MSIERMVYTGTSYFGEYARKENITVKINTIPSVIHSWVMTHINQCEIIGPKSFRDKIQNEIMDAYRKYCM